MKNLILFIIALFCVIAMAGICFVLFIFVLPVLFYFIVEHVVFVVFFVLWALAVIYAKNLIY